MIKSYHHSAVAVGTRYHGNFPTVRRVLERDVARHECTNENLVSWDRSALPCSEETSRMLVERRRWFTQMMKRSRAGAHWRQRKAAAFTEWHKPHKAIL